MLALMLYTSYEISVSISIECGLLFHYCSMGVWRCLSVHNRQLDPHFFYARLVVGKCVEFERFILLTTKISSL